MKILSTESTQNILFYVKFLLGSVQIGWAGFVSTSNSFTQPPMATETNKTLDRENI